MRGTTSERLATGGEARLMSCTLEAGVSCTWEDTLLHQSDSDTRQDWFMKKCVKTFGYVRVGEKHAHTPNTWYSKCHLSHLISRNCTVEVEALMNTTHRQRVALRPLWALSLRTQDRTKEIRLGFKNQYGSGSPITPRSVVHPPCFP